MAVDRQGIGLGRVAGVPVRMNWSALLGAYVFTGFSFNAVTWLTFFGLVLAHELGHALVVKAVGARPVQIELTAFGGLCHWRGEPSTVGRAAIAWGGVWAQLLVLGAAELYLWRDGAARWNVNESLVLDILTRSNVWMIALNMLPIPPLDGAEAWRLPILLGRRMRRGKVGLQLPAAPSPARPGSADEAFEAGERRDEVKAVVASLLDEARRE